MVCDISSKLCAAFTKLCRASTCWWRGSKSQSKGTLKQSATKLDFWFLNDKGITTTKHCNLCPKWLTILYQSIPNKFKKTNTLPCNNTDYYQKKLISCKALIFFYFIIFVFWSLFSNHLYIACKLPKGAMEEPDHHEILLCSGVPCEHRCSSHHPGQQEHPKVGTTGLYLRNGWTSEGQNDCRNCKSFNEISGSSQSNFRGFCVYI